MTYETETTKTMTDRELAEAIVDDRIARGQFGDDDRDWLVEREMRETRESLVNGFSAIEHWNEADDDDDQYEDEDEGRSPFDGNTSDLGDLLGDFEWQYDIDAVVDMLTITTPNGTFWLRDDEVPDWSEVDDACMWAPITENIEHILEWYNSHADTDIVDVDDEMVLDALTKGTDEERIWKPLTCSEVEDIIYDLALLTSDNIGCMPADDISDEWLDEMYEVMSWADVRPMWIEPEDERVTLGRVWFALVDDPYGFPTWKHLIRSQVAEIVDDVLA